MAGGWQSYSCRWGWWEVSTAGQVLWTTYFPQIHWADRSGSLCAAYSDPATDISLSWTAPSIQQAQNLSYQGSLVYKRKKILYNGKTIWLKLTFFFNMVRNDERSLMNSFKVHLRLHELLFHYVIIFCVNSPSKRLFWLYHSPFPSPRLY